MQGAFNSEFHQTSSFCSGVQANGRDDADYLRRWSVGLSTGYRSRRASRLTRPLVGNAWEDNDCRAARCRSPLVVQTGWRRCCGLPEREFKTVGGVDGRRRRRQCVSRFRCCGYLLWVDPSTREAVVMDASGELYEVPQYVADGELVGGTKMGGRRRRRQRHAESRVRRDAREVPLTSVCGHRLGQLPCINPDPHRGYGRGCVHDAGDVADRHLE